MAYVITQRCCNDASCVAICPVDCIRPRPDDPEFISTEMLYIDPQACIDCGACVPACPVEAIYPDDELPANLERFAEINELYFAARPLQMRPSPFDVERVTDLGALRVAIVGTGPAAMYAAVDVLARVDAEVEIFEKLPTPWGLVRAGVSPDHAETKTVTAEFDDVLADEAVAMHLNVAVGTHIGFDELLDYHHAVIYAGGAAQDRRLGIEGEDLPGSHAASEFVAWYNGHPDYADATFDLSGERAVIVGNGNVALDMARILTMDVDELARTDIADHALEALRHSKIREVVVLGRRGPAQAAYTAPEFLAMGSIPGVDVVIDPAEAKIDPATAKQLRDLDPAIQLKVDLAAEYAQRVPSGGNKRIVFRYLSSPVAISGEQSVESVEVAKNKLVRRKGAVSAKPTDVTETVKTSLVLRSIGYRATPVEGLPFDEARAVVPNDGGRVHDGTGQTVPGMYVAGWIKRGPTGGIGTNKFCSQETVAAMVDDFQSGQLSTPPGGRTELAELLAARQPDLLSAIDWDHLDDAETTRGAAAGRPRVKFTSTEDMVAVARQRSHR